MKIRIPTRWVLCEEGQVLDVDTVTITFSDGRQVTVTDKLKGVDFDSLFEGVDRFRHGKSATTDLG
jgi:hypothetical protein